jgi:hypothetical protein
MLTLIHGEISCLVSSLWNEARDIELRRPLTQEEEIRRQRGIPHDQIVQDRLWNKRPDGIAFKVPTKGGVGVICLLEFKRMSDVSQGWKVEQVSFITGTRSLNEEEIKKNLAYFEVPSASVEPIRAKLVMVIFDEYTNILKGMYSSKCLVVSVMSGLSGN